MVKLLSVKQADVLPRIESTRRREHLLELDGIRAFAILSVLAVHLFFVAPHLAHMPTGLPQGVEAVLKHGWLGVDLFFVLSGFLITRILLDSRKAGFRSYFAHFYRRRSLRVLPLYLVVLAALAIAYSSTVGPKYFVLCLAFVANLAPVLNVNIPSGGGPLWSLAVEEQFYLVWPILVLVLNRRQLFWTSIAIIVVEPILRFFNTSQPIELTWFRCDGLATGALLALWSTWSGRTRQIDGRLVIALVALCATIIIVGIPFGGAHDGPLSRATRISEALCAFAALVIFAVSRSGKPQTAFLRLPFLKVTADLSFCIYLIHSPLIDIYNALMGHAKPNTFGVSPLAASTLRAAVVLAAAYAIAAISRRYLELPFMRIGGRAPAESNAR